ncbi:uncharacterized lipoprotein YddW (UPF0748 family) [Deinobacterium chartae]|uniref:Uncharacterized lipoprotein YddW (UPF0748 family) n=1 Tax=Deinobacterium chartae TaxID=521158 RepID=A0A841I0C7_9DEIO|nr:family 10 glycosylhydrolase [Deinobacterium chartae]MBB6097435.1 uncharacterized lipoprotein YddW (UPF0748 family) [Deinobacterium chartae]
MQALLFFLTLLFGTVTGLRGESVTQPTAAPTVPAPATSPERNLQPSNPQVPAEQLPPANQPLPPGALETPEPPTLLPANARSGILGAWLRPNARENPLEVLRSLKEVGYTDIFLETFYHGFTLYPSSIAPSRPELGDRDLLGEYVAAAAQLGLRLHAWLEVLYWAPPAQYGVRGGLLDRFPYLETRDAQGRSSRRGIHGMGFADPGLQETRLKVYALGRELATRYPNVGLHLDYLRYPAGGDYGYHPQARRAFSAQTGLEARPYVMEWYAWRQNVLTQVANGISRAYREAGGRGLVTAAVNPEFPFYKGETLQTWTRWTEVDVFIPMAYSRSNAYLKLLSRWIRNRSPRPVWMGLQVGPQYPDLQSQINTLKPEGFSNFVIFGRLK